MGEGRGKGKFQTFHMPKIIPGRYIRSNQRTNRQPDLFWASIQYLAISPSIGLHSNYGGRGKFQTFHMLKIIPVRYIRSNQRTHRQPDKFQASIQYLVIQPSYVPEKCLKCSKLPFKIIKHLFLIIQIFFRFYQYHHMKLINKFCNLTQV